MNKKYPLTVFLSSFLLFIIQPIAGKSLLPLYGGTSSVWTSVLLFFMSVLFLGYLYTVLLSALPSRRQIRIHLTLILLTFSSLFLPASLGTPTASNSPVFSLLLFLTFHFGLPVFLLATTSTLLQHWLSLASAISPYRLYAVSNLGSLLALLSYPLAVEPTLSLTAGQNIWRVLLLLCLILLAILTRSQAGQSLQTKPTLVKTGLTSPRLWLWLGLATASNAVLIASTAHLTPGISPLPLLWLLPLALYLLSYILTFSIPSWQTNRFPGVILFGILSLYSLIIKYYPANNLLGSVLLELSLISVIFLVLHTELYRLKPAKSGLTLYYLMIALGGVLAGLFCAILAPAIFTQLWEFPLSLALSVLVTGLVLFKQAHSLGYKLILACLSLISLYLIWDSSQPRFIREGEVIAEQRNFYGLVQVVEERADNQVMYREMVNGSITHGSQSYGGNNAAVPTEYYTRDSGIGRTLAGHPRKGSQPLRIGVIGLGVGTLAAYCGPGDYLRFYEINPLVITYAEEYFTYLSDCRSRGGQLDLIEGDARTSLEQELHAGGSGNFDVLAVDAFTDDAIPVHLLTLEALDLYLSHLSDQGIIAFHITNQYLDLLPVLKAAARVQGLHLASYQDSESSWVMLTPNLVNQQFNFTQSLVGSPSLKPWTDNHNSLLQSLNWF